MPVGLVEVVVVLKQRSFVFSQAEPENKEFWDTFGVSAESTEVSSSNQNARNRTEFDDVVSGQTLSSTKFTDDDVDLEAWLNEGTTTTTTTTPPPKAASSTEDSWGGWEEVGWDSVDVTKTNNEISVTSSKND